MSGDLTPLNLDYRLVMVDGCCSAQTTSDNLDGAYDCNTLAQTVEEFANSFGPKVAYMGWAWTMNAGRAQSLTGQLVEFLKYDIIIERPRTLREARMRLLDATYDRNRQEKQEAKLIKIYGEVENVIDLSVKGGS